MPLRLQMYAQLQASSWAQKTCHIPPIRVIVHDLRPARTACVQAQEAEERRGAQPAAQARRGRARGACSEGGRG